MRTCRICGNSFDGDRAKVRTCNPCRSQKYREKANKRCIDCGILVFPTTTRCKDCRGKAFSGENHPSWLGGRHETKAGYVLLRNERTKNHPNNQANGCMMEHILTMSDHLGRPLLPGENVHHKNGVKNDNDIDNLELWVTTQPSGQRPKDLVHWAKEILSRYEADVQGGTI